MADSTNSIDERGAPIDTIIEIVTPENIAFHYRLAGPFRRLPAYLIDLSICGALMATIWIALAILGAFTGLIGVSMGIATIVAFFVSWFYGGICETFFNGQTIGKRALRLRVISFDGRPINATQAILRNVLRSADMLPIVIPYLFGLISCVLNDRFQRMGDLACGTMVVVEEPIGKVGISRVTEPEALALVPRIPNSFVVTPPLARALSSYVLRRRSLPWARRVEVARHLAEPLRDRLGLPVGTSYDMLLCALYHRTFIAEGVLA